MDITDDRLLLHWAERGLSTSHMEQRMKNIRCPKSGTAQRLTYVEEYYQDKLDAANNRIKELETKHGTR